MILTSPSFEDGKNIPKKFTCDGGNINPELLIQNVPEGAKSLALIMHDPDAPRKGGFTHWVVWNISPSTTVIKEESVPPMSEEGKNGSGEIGYAGPCPPSGTHHYEFRLYALDAPLALSEDTDKAALEKEIEKHLLDKTTLTGLYARS
jgi:Raf kinase inhibitor-like YbhB/YbcL family protein